VKMSRFVQADERSFGSGRPLRLFEKTFVSALTSIKACVIQAIPDFPADIADIIDVTVKGHITHDVHAKDYIKKYGLTQLQAEAISWWSADVSIFSELPTEKSPYHVYNTALRQRDVPKIRLWKDFSFYFIGGLEKLHPIQIESFRGEKKRVMELSSQYVKSNQARCTGAAEIKTKQLPRSDYDFSLDFISTYQVVWIGFTSTTTDRQHTLKQFGSSGTFFKIKILYGRDISGLSLFPDECELLLMPNSVFTVQTALSSAEVTPMLPPSGIERSLLLASHCRTGGLSQSSHFLYLCTCAHVCKFTCMHDL